MPAPLCLMIGAGRIAAGHVAPLMREAGWDVVLVTRTPLLAQTLRRTGRVIVDVAGSGTHVVDGIGARTRADHDLAALVARADLLGVCVGPTALDCVGGWLAPLLLHRLLETRAPLNIVTFENHRRAADLLAHAVIAAEPALAGAIGARIGIAGAAVWRVASHRDVTPDGLRVRVDDVPDTYVDALSLLPGAAPSDGSVPGLDLVAPFDAWMCDKLWVFNAGHAAAAYHGWLAGAATVADAIAVPAVRGAVERVLAETRDAVLSLAPGARPPGSAPDVARCLARYADAAMADPVTRVAREPRRKLAPGDRLLGPAVTAAGSGRRPAALAATIASALRYADAADPQASLLRREVELDGPAEVLATLCGLDPSDELSRLVCRRYEELR